jgi:hypothetical protein
VTPEQRKKYRNRATRAAREFKKETELHDSVIDGAGRRYYICIYFLMAGDLEKAAATFDWFDASFPDDRGIPIFHAFGALAAYRKGEMIKARTRLLHAQLGNIFLLPYLAEQDFDVPDIRYFSNYEVLGYLEGVMEFLEEPTAEERLWIASEINSELFVMLKKGYVVTAMMVEQHEQDLAKCRIILDNWRRFQAEAFRHLSNPSSPLPWEDFLDPSWDTLLRMRIANWWRHFTMS